MRSSGNVACGDQVTSWRQESCVQLVPWPARHPCTGWDSPDQQCRATVRPLYTQASSSQAAHSLHRAINVLMPAYAGWHPAPVSLWLFTAARMRRTHATCGTKETPWEALVVTRDADGKTGMSRWLRGDRDDSPTRSQWWGRLWRMQRMRALSFHRRPHVPGPRR